MPLESVRTDGSVEGSDDKERSGEGWSQALGSIQLAVSPNDPADAIRRFGKLVMRLPKKTKVIWNRADKQFDIGIQAGFQPDSLEWILKPAMVKEAAKMGAQVRITVYGVDLLRRSELRRD